ncbi:hypothetical protein rolling_6 [Escherichia phage rolling]|uniref:Uncharacterized protein n=1 Tax=Escherichia phage rolling TaxID=2696442 RepID=A0A6B9WRK6_9CAUD|nr:hypothetical protein P9601_gp06 [Escherichia phage rolling]QHR66305.1 hypothetical protein rolling_6 [Escherichia phage rolling]
MKILQEEKNYWAAQCLEAREQVERANALADTNQALYEGEKKVRHELEDRFELLFELMGIMQRTGYTTSVALNRITADGLREHCKRAEEYVRPKGRQSKIDRKDLVPVGWLGREELHRYALSAEVSKRILRILNSDKKIALYAISPDHDEE